MIETANLRPGDLVLVYSPMRGDGSGMGSSATGLYVVLDSSSQFASVVSVSSFGTNVRVSAVDLVAHIRPEAVTLSALPASRANVTPEPPAAAPTAPEEVDDWQSLETVPVSVPFSRHRGAPARKYSFANPRPESETTYEAFDSRGTEAPHVNNSSRMLPDELKSWDVVNVQRRHLSKFLRGIAGSYPLGHAEKGHPVDEFGELDEMMRKARLPRATRPKE